MYKLNYVKIIFLYALTITVIIHFNVLGGDWPQYQHDAARSGYSSDNIAPPTTVVWRWHPANNKLSISGRVQPVIQNQVLCIGFYNGTMYGLNSQTGAELWSYQSGGAITHSAGMDSGKVYFGATDGKVYCLNATNGALVWSYQTRGSIQTAPLIADGKIIIGATNGLLYALDLTDGRVIWIYDSGAPILTTAAYGSGYVYCGNEACQAFCVNSTDGSQRWKVQLHGQTMSVYCPVLVDSKGVVFYRTGPLNVFHTLLGEGDSQCSAGGCSGYNCGYGTSEQITAEQDRFITYLNGEPTLRKSFWALNTTDGTEKYTVPVLYTSGEGTIPVPPVVDEANSRCWLIWRTLYARFDTGMIVRPYTDLGILNLTTGRITHFDSAIASGFNNQFHLIGDETSILSASGNVLFVSGRGTLGGIDMRSSPGSLFHTCASFENDDYWNGGGPYAYGGSWPKGSITAGGGCGGGYVAAAAIADGGVFWIARWGLLVRTQ